MLSRGAVRQDVYRDEIDRKRFLTVFAGAVGRHGWRCHAYCLMGNHYHLLVETPDADLAAGMHLVNGAYAQWFNRRHDLTGHVFEARYASILVERQSHLLELARYLPLNPVRAGMCTDPGEWPWSSYRATAGIERPADWLTLELVLGSVGGAGETARARYRSFVREGIAGRDMSGGQAPGHVPWGHGEGPAGSSARHGAGKLRPAGVPAGG